MTDPHEDLVEKGAELLHRIWAESDMKVSAAFIALIAERTKDATPEMCLAAIERDNLKGDWRSMHRASALWPKEKQ